VSANPDSDFSTMPSIARARIRSGTAASKVVLPGLQEDAAVRLARAIGPSSPTRRASLQHGRPEPRNWATFPWRTRGLDWMREIADSTIARGKEGLR